MHCLDILDQLQPALARQRDVGKHKIGFARFHGIKRLADIFGSAAHNQIRLMVDQVDKPRARHRMIIHD